MLDNHPRHQLRFIIDNYGRSIIDDPRRCRGMLKDLAPKHQRETNLLMLALDQKLVAELTQKTHTPILMHLDILAQRLHNNIGIQKDFAVWAIESWALALDVIQQPSTQKIITPEPAPIPTIVKPEPKIIVPPKPVPIISKPTPIVSTSSKQTIGKFIVQDGVATDTTTGLMWLRFAYGQRWENGTVLGNAKKVNWDNAMKIPDTFNKQGYAGYNDWRVPTIEELKTIVLGEGEEAVGFWNVFWKASKGKAGNYIIDQTIFLNSPAYSFWSSSPYAGNSNLVAIVLFSHGFSTDSGKLLGGYVRLVR